MQRFEREAQVLASLNHPNIAHLYGVEQNALVMEFVDGDDLRGPVPVDTAIAYARQIAAGLEAAHEKGIVHRDLKPANIKVTSDGTIKLLDFGLAKSPAVSDDSATLTISMTQAGMILGTAGYMSPEQARGKPVDKRTDIWAFGVILYELLTGRHLFAAGETLTDVLAAVVTREPDWNALPTDTPAYLRRLLQKCLKKDPKQRLRDIGDGRIALEEPESIADPVAAPVATRSKTPWIAAAAMAVLAAALALRNPSPTSAPAPFFRVVENPVEPIEASATQGPAMALSPDGSRIVYVNRIDEGATRLSIRRLDQAAPTPLTGTEGAAEPFFSPDGRSVGYVTPDGIYKIPAEGGPPTRITATHNNTSIRGAAFLDGNTIVYGHVSGPLMQVAATGGEARPFDTKDPSEGGHRWPVPSPDESHVVFMVTRFDSVTGPMLVAESRRDGKRIKIVENASFGRFLPSGELSFVRAGVLLAAPLDSQFQPTTDPRPILKDIAPALDTGASHIAIARNGTVAYVPGWIDNDRPNLTWLYPDGRREVVASVPQALAPRISPDGKRVAYGVGQAILRSTNDFYVRDLERGTTTRVTKDGQGKHAASLWTPDGRFLLYSGFAGPSQGTYQVPADGSAAPRRLLDAQLAPIAFTPDGKTLLLALPGKPPLAASVTFGENGVVLGQPAPLPVGSGAPGLPENAISPDGKWMAYRLSEGGPSQIFVQPFASPGQRYAVASGSTPVWSRTGLALFFSTFMGTEILTVNCSVVQGAFHCGAPRKWSDQHISMRGGTGSFDVAQDGRILALTPPESPKTTGDRVHLLFHFDGKRAVE